MSDEGEHSKTEGNRREDVGGKAEQKKTKDTHVLTLVAI